MTMQIRSLARSFWRINRPLSVFFWAMIGTSALGVIAMALDGRTVGNVSNWAKTTKFSMSIALYSATMLWVFGMDTLRPRLSRFILTGTAWLLGLEMVLIIFQGARAVPMHFNNATPFDAALFQVMAASITLFWFVTALGIAVLTAQRLESRALAWSLRLGLIVALLGMLQGYMMTSPTPAQMAALQAGQQVDMIGAHTVGAPDGGPGLPLLGWSTTYGDLRVGHFVGLHGLQIVPLLGLLLSRRRERWLSEAHRVALVWIGAGGYLGLVALVTWQALRQQPLLAPDALTLAALAALIAATAGAALLVILRARTGSRDLAINVVQ